MNKQALRWDAHACLPLHPGASFEPLIRYAEAGLHYVSINVGMDLNPLEQVMRVLSAFRERVKEHPELTLVSDLKSLRAERASPRPRLTVGFDLEGALPLIGAPTMVSLYHALGVRQVHLAYNRNNHAAGGCHDLEAPLSELGGRFVDAINRAGILMDCAHNGARTTLDVAQRSRAPVVLSHANPRSLVDHERNVSDEVISAVAMTGGVICLNGVSWFLGAGAPSVERLVDHVMYVVARVGVTHTGVGLDTCFTEPHLNDDPPPPYDPSYWWPERSGYVDGLGRAQFLQPEVWRALPERLIARGLSSAEVDLILGENMARVFGQVEQVAIELKAKA